LALRRTLLCERAARTRDLAKLVASESRPSRAGRAVLPRIAEDFDAHGRLFDNANLIRDVCLRGAVRAVWRANEGSIQSSSEISDAGAGTRASDGKLRNPAAE
jgi:hypothetical protein